MIKPITAIALTTALCAAFPAAAEVAVKDRAAIRNQPIASNAFAKERFMVRARAIYVAPDESSNLNIGGDLHVSKSVTPEVDLSYFFTDHIAAELIAATSKHHLEYNGATNIGDAWILPPTITLQYHFTPNKAFSPYIGAGVNYSFFYGESSANGFTDLDVHNGLGYAFQAGFDYWLDDHWGVNFDIKKLMLNVNASANNGVIQADVDLDPWIMGAGVSYRF